ncbi:MAG: nucleotidyltransferase family protein [Nanoarchaeota archaeon]
MTLKLSDLGLSAFEGDTLYLKFLNALNKFIEEYYVSPVTNIILIGSLARGELKPDSDIDLILIDNNYNELLEKKIDIGDTEINYVIGSEKAFRDEMQKEKHSNKRIITTGLYESKLLVGDGLSDLLGEAQNVYKSTLPEIPYAEKNNAVHFLLSQKKELQRLLNENKTINFHLRLNHVIQDCVKNYFRAKKLFWPPWKRISEKIPDKDFKNILENVLTQTNNQQKLNNLNMLIDYIVSLLKS